MEKMFYNQDNMVFNQSNQYENSGHMAYFANI